MSNCIVRGDLDRSPKIALRFVRESSNDGIRQATRHKRVSSAGASRSPSHPTRSSTTLSSPVPEHCSST
jgi:hypothetical protein